MKYGSLFSGIGGIDLGFDRAGMECVWQVEIDDYATKVLKKHWPEVHREKDIRECGKHNLEWVDVIAGGFPCQDISYAGRGAGLDGERSGLFFEAVRVVRELQPRFIVLENVAALLTRGLDRVLGTLAEIGYDAEWHCIPAAAVGAPHIRDRVFIIAIRRMAQHSNRNDERKIRKCAKFKQDAATSRDCGWKDPSEMADSNCERCSEARCSESGCGASGRGSSLADAQSVYAQRLDNRSRKVELGRSSWWAVEPAVGRVANGVPSRVDRLRGLGNAVVPQVAEWIGRRLMVEFTERE